MDCYNSKGCTADCENCKYLNDGKYTIYADDKIVECVDIDDMTDHVNALLSSGHKEVRLVIND